MICNTLRFLPNEYLGTHLLLSLSCPFIQGFHPAGSLAATSHHYGALPSDLIQQCKQLRHSSCSDSKGAQTDLAMRADQRELSARTCSLQLSTVPTVPQQNGGGASEADKATATHQAMNALNLALNLISYLAERDRRRTKPPISTQWRQRLSSWKHFRSI